MTATKNFIVPMRYFKGEYLTLAVAAVMLSGCSRNDSDTELVGNWSKLLTFKGQTRLQATGFVINDSAYVGTGFRPDVAPESSRFKDLFVYDPVKDNWGQRADMPDAALPRSGAVGMAIGGKGYIGTGTTTAGLNNNLNDFWEFNPQTNSWSRKANFPGTPRQGAVAFSVKGVGVIATGRDQGGYLYDAWRFKPGSSDADPGTWSPASDVPKSKKWHATAFVIADKAYVAGGNDGQEDLDELSMYDADADTWTSKRSTSNESDDSYDDEYTDVTRSSAAAFVLNNKAYLCTGTSGSSILSTVWEYEPTGDQWTKKQAFEGNARFGAVGFTVKGKGYLCTGGSSSSGTEDNWTFDPNAEYDKLK